jgi:hypothetical protein
MDRELEVAAAASAGGWLRWNERETLEPGTPCPNCETVLQGAYCHGCGQLAESFERSVWGLAVEGFESFFHFDGRFWRTLPNLAIHPGRLTRDYLDGKRAFQIPPLRLFLVVLLLVFFTGGLHLGKVRVKSVDELKPAERAEVEKALGEARDSVTPAVFGLNAKTGPAGAASRPADEPGVEMKLKGFGAWMYQQGKVAKRNPELFEMVLESWGHRFAILLLPISALFLSVLFVFQRRFYVFDHLIFSMHSLSFQGLLLSVSFLLGQLTSLSGLLLLAAPVHLFVHMRGTYETSVPGTLLRMVLLSIGTSIAVLFLILGLVWVGLAALQGH